MGKKCSYPLKAAQCWESPSIKEVKWWGESERSREKKEKCHSKSRKASVACRARHGKKVKSKKRCTLWPVLQRRWVVDHLCLQGHGYFLNNEPLRILHAASGRSSPVFSLHDGRPSASSEDEIGQRHCFLLWVCPNIYPVYLMKLDWLAFFLHVSHECY